ncbi:hypothetical protein OAV86_04360, partial [Pseudomonadales bacterium]|nr:hypothetical protein [Pseudomonadales bacterium]
ADTIGFVQEGHGQLPRIRSPLQVYSRHQKSHPSRLSIHPFYERLRAYPSACQILARSYLRTVSTAFGFARAFEPKARQAFSTRRFIQMSCALNEIKHCSAHSFQGS